MFFSSESPRLDLSPLIFHERKNEEGFMEKLGKSVDVGGERCKLVFEVPFLSGGHEPVQRLAHNKLLTRSASRSEVGVVVQG